MEIKQLLGARIKEIRKKRHLTQEQLAEKVGINPKYVSSIERGKENPTLDTFIKIAESLEVGIGDLFNRLEPENPKRRIKDIVSMLEQAPAEQQKLALKVLSALFI
ncbi:transcriptional regulator [Desulfosarcina widdelii]|uniref:Transcriptional regulator n=1 Tax=Desulfosarcina widdelii TaxID=947919 RepID=A0A5K7YYX1_9BACT|nr:helix-turn-helix transcriptional regulator [Desulfosarcina widdelii]BBO73123.1 transcriptional regulator [Desulfosarcina widdelii]